MSLADYVLDEGVILRMGGKQDHSRESESPGFALQAMSVEQINRLCKCSSQS